MSNSWNEEGKWIVLANVLEAETLTGHGIPSWPALWDVISYAAIHELYFVDWKSRESITIWFAESHPNMTVAQMMAVRNSFVKKLIAQQNGRRTAIRARGSDIPEVVGQKQLKLSYGELINADQILVPLVKGGTAKGLQVHLTMDGKVYHVLTYGKSASERRFVEFLNEWRSASLIPRQSNRLTPQEKSMAYTKRGEFLVHITMRRPAAVEYFQKAIQFEPKNSEARLQLQSLTNAMGQAREAEKIKH